jgi:transcriptional regulator with XRE-family HTH domain
MSELNQPLRRAVQYLYGKGLIRRDKDIADKTGYNKTSVSSYINGNVKASDRFLQAFQRTFKIELSKFEEGSPEEIVTPGDPMQLLMERILKTYAVARVNQSLLIEILAAQTGKTVMELHRVVSSAMEVETKEILRELRQDELKA